MANQMIINAASTKGIINRMIYGHFAEHLGRCIYDGFYVGEDSPIPNVRGIRKDIVDALKALNIPCLRWPGGCFADEYHWKDGIGPKESRVEMVNTHWGGVVENNHFGTHEFFDLCEMLGAEPYICGNVGSGTVREMSEWIEYMTFDGKSPMADLRRKNGREKPWHLKYFGVGNENWGCGGRMRAEYYADEVLRYNTYARDYGENHLYRIAAGPRGSNYHWTEVLMRDAAMHFDAIALHYYTRLGDPVVTVNIPDGNERYLRDETRSRTSATDFAEDAWFGIMKAANYTEELIQKHTAIMDRYDPEKRVALIVDEWGTWFDCEPGTNPGFLYQQNTLRDALSAAVTLNIFNNHCDRVQMANIAQTINVLQAMILTEGSQIVLTPTYHVFDMYQVHQDAQLLDFALLSDDYCYGDDHLKQISSSVSKAKDGTVNMTLCNIDPNKTGTVKCHIEDLGRFTVDNGMVLTSQHMQDKNTFDNPDTLHPVPFTDYFAADGTLTINMPPKSVVLLALKPVCD
ncbi:MAG: alpha-N-arabinofuranosidase [Clostridiaceae bacterium]|nr:alpha-N-arabinofuranosidase [Clostridiaceae bacterium]